MHLLFIHRFHDTSVRAVVERGSEEDLISRLRVLGMELALILKVAQGVRASRAC